jgi:excisionase family DNA binding protein
MANDYPQVVPVGSKFWHDAAMPDRFLTLADVAEVLNISASQTYALVRSGELPAIKIGGRGQWRVESGALEAYIARMYEQTATFVAAHPFSGASESEGSSSAAR